MQTEASFERPAKGVLVIKLSNGEFITNPTEADLRKFGLVDRGSVYMRVDKFLQRVAEIASVEEVTDLRLNPLRYAFELACYDDDGLDPLTADEGLVAQVVVLEQTLRGMFAEKS